MRYLTRKASKAYFELSRISYVCDFIGWTHFLDRMEVLSELTRPKDPIRIRANRILLTEEWFQNDPWTEGPDDEITNESIRVIVQSHSIDEEGEERDVFLFLAGVPGLEDWHFHQYDVDFFPSIPHGHWKGRKKQKLDAYLGWVYEGTKQTRRERRPLILSLWNDEGFRVFAATAIDYYLDNHPHYTGWRVSNPRKLPRKR